MPPDADEEKRSVLLDTNALMMQFQFYLDVETELRRVVPGPFEIIVPSVVIDELNALVEKGDPKTKGEAEMSIKLAETFDIVESEGVGDQAIIKLAEKLDGLVVTNDKILRARLRAKGIPNVHMRSKAFLSVEGFPGF